METSLKIRTAAIILMAAGYGWAGGHYIPSSSGLLAYLFQFIIIGALLISGIAFFTVGESAGRAHKRAVTALNVLSVVFFIINILNIAHGFFNTDPKSFGSHNTFADLVPIAIILLGSGLWMVTMLPYRRPTR